MAHSGGIPPSPAQQRASCSGADSTLVCGVDSSPASAAHPTLEPGPRAHRVRDALPSGGLFADQHWRIATEPFYLGPDLAGEIETLGRVLLQFYKATNLLYRRSHEGKAPEWVAHWLDQGKPPELIALQRDPAFRNDLPRVIRPDLLLTDDGLRITELDSVPGGIGLTTWLYETYEAAQPGIATSAVGGSSPRKKRAQPSVRSWVGSAKRMEEGFMGVFQGAPRVHIIVAEESATYRPEMEWLSRRIQTPEVHIQPPDFTSWQEGDGVYRFFELFDLPNVPAATPLFDAAREKRVRLTPPPRPMFEEKLLFALLWNRHLQSYWRQELGEAFLNRLLRLVPCTWFMDPTPLPPHGGIPMLGLSDWQQLKELSQRERELVLKVSGFSEDAWGARGVYLGSDLSSADWAATIDQALAAWPKQPYVLQRYHKPGLVNVTWYDFSNETVVPMPGRVRLCPYYFVHADGDAARPHLGGVLATTCPADKKIIHGMRDAVLAPCAIEEDRTAEAESVSI